MTRFADDIVMIAKTDVKGDIQRAPDEINEMLKILDLKIKRSG